MSEMTATRIGLATLTALWLVAALLLWRTDVPRGLEVEATSAPFAALELDRHERHDRVLRLLALGSLAAQVAALALFARRPPRGRGPALVRAAQLGALAAVVLLLARLPFGLTVLWWQRRYGVAELGYLRWLLERLGPLAVRALLLAFAAALALWLARRYGRRWWIGAGAVFAAVGAAVVLVQPLVSPRLEPVPRPAVVRQVEELAARQGLDRPEVELRRTRDRTRAVSAEAIGIGPTTRVILWGTTLDLSRNVRGFLVAHELAHVSRSHLWKGLAWFVLLLVPGLALLARLSLLDAPEHVPRAVLVAFALLLLATPLANAVSRRYEAEADWVGIETTRDASGAHRLLARLAEAGVRDPSPPRWWTLLFGTHPSLSERAGLVDAWVRTPTSRAGPSRGGS
jgi:Zn-dependent protease with chaperone function